MKQVSKVHLYCAAIKVGCIWSLIGNTLWKVHCRTKNRGEKFSRISCLKIMFEYHNFATAMEVLVTRATSDFTVSIALYCGFQYQVTHSCLSYQVPHLLRIIRSYIHSHPNEVSETPHPPPWHAVKVLEVFSQVDCRVGWLYGSFLCHRRCRQDSIITNPALLKSTCGQKNGQWLCISKELLISPDWDWGNATLISCIWFVGIGWSNKNMSRWQTPTSVINSHIP